MNEWTNECDILRVSERGLVVLYLQRNCRYDGQIAVFGEQFQQRLSNAKLFLVSLLTSWYLLCVYIGMKTVGNGGHNT